MVFIVIVVLMIWYHSIGKTSYDLSNDYIYMPLNPILRCNVMSNEVDINDPSSQLRINGLLLLTCSLLVVISFMDKGTRSIS
jgi:hypothetical protein